MMRVAGNDMEPHGQSPLTLVTAWFDLGRKQTKYQGNPYPGWIRNFLPLVRWPLVIFCDEQSLDMLKEARGDKPVVYRVTRPEEFYMYKYWSLLKEMEGEKPSAEVSLIWHEKHHFLRQTLLENPFDSEMLFWCDMGMFRYRRDAPGWSACRRQFRLFDDVEWPNLKVCRALPQDKAILIYARHTNAMCGGFFGGAVEPLRRWCDAYYRRVERRVRKGTFILSDEHVMFSCWRRQRELAHVLSGVNPFLIHLLKRGKHGADFKWYFLNGKRFPWGYAFRRLFSGPAQ